MISDENDERIATQQKSHSSNDVWPIKIINHIISKLISAAIITDFLLLILPKS
jgi:hypothetical protein